VIQLNDEQYWLYAVVNPETNELLYTALKPMINKLIAHVFFAELREIHKVYDVVFLIDSSHSLKNSCRRHSVECIFREMKRRTDSFSNCFSNAEADTADDGLRSFTWNRLI
jgi:transposase-like protein